MRNFPPPLKGATTTEEQSVNDAPTEPLENKEEEQTVTTPELSSDESQEATHETDIQVNEDEEHPTELNMGTDPEEA